MTLGSNNHGRPHFGELYGFGQCLATFQFGKHDFRDLCQRLFTTQTPAHPHTPIPLSLYFYRNLQDITAVVNIFNAAQIESAMVNRTFRTIRLHLNIFTHTHTIHR